MTAINEADAVAKGALQADRAYLGSTLVWQKFRPTDYTGLKVWLDASQLSLAQGAAVSAWPNLAGAPNPTLLGSPAPTFQLNALNTIMPVVRITQGQGRWRFTGTGVDKDWTLAYVGRNWNNSGGRIITALAAPSNPNIVVGFHATEMDVCYVEAWLTSSTSPTATTAWKLYSADSASTAAARFFVNGALRSTDQPTPAYGWGGTLNISGWTNAADSTSQWASAEIAELVMYNRKLTDTERQKVEYYLRKKWGF